MIDRYDKGLVWDENDHFIDQPWSDLKTKIRETHGGLGIIAADFNELLRYGQGYGVQNRRDHFTKLVLNATQEDDIELLADILSIILRKPWETNLQGGWFIHRLRKTDTAEVFDANRAAQVINALYKIYPYATEVLMFTLRNFVDTYENELRLLDLLLKTGQLCKEVVLMINPATVFISYAREDAKTVERLYSALINLNFKVWKDDHELLPGEKWELKIMRALKEYEFVIVCLSEISVSKRGFFQAELKAAAKKQAQRSSSDVYIIPVKLDGISTEKVPEEVEELHYVDLSEDWEKGINDIATTINKYRR